MTDSDDSDPSESVVHADTDAADHLKTAIERVWRDA